MNFRQVLGAIPSRFRKTSLREWGNPIRLAHAIVSYATFRGGNGVSFRPLQEFLEKGGQCPFRIVTVSGGRVAAAKLLQPGDVVIPSR